MRDHVVVLSHFPAGSYHFLGRPGAPFSSAIMADPGFDLVHATFLRPVPLAGGLDAAARHVEAAGRPVTALAGFELRIPEPFTADGFSAFNAPYVERLRTMGLTTGDSMPAVRTNVAPTVPGIAEPSVYAFTYTIPGRGRQSVPFRLSGATESRRDGSAADRLLSIVEVLESRLAELGAAWTDATAVNVYGAANDAATDVAVRLGVAALHGLTWFPSLPPVREYDYEIDAMGVGTELTL